MTFANTLRTTLGAAALLASSMAMSAPITANVGWIADQLSTAGGATDGSPFTFTLAEGQIASFKVTDQFLTGDSFTLFSAGSLLATSSAFAGAAHAIVGDATGEAGWLSASYEKIEYTFAEAGTYAFNIVGDGVGGIPAGLYVRLDVIAGSVPEPSSLALMALALAGVGVAARRRQKAG